MKKDISPSTLAEKVCLASGVSLEELIGREKRTSVDVARGVFFMLSVEYGIHPKEASSYVGRSRSSCIVTAKHYKGYYDTKDKEVCKIVEKIKSFLKE